MAVNYQELAKKYGGVPVDKQTPTAAPTPVNNYSEIAKKYGGTVVSQAPAATPQPTQPQPEQKGFFRKVGDFFTGNTQKFGQTIGSALNAPKAASMYGEELEQHTNLQSQLLKTIAAKKKLGQDTSRLEGVLQDHIEVTPKLEDYTGDVINKTGTQIAGEAAGTALEALSGGVLGKGTSIAASKAIPVTQKIVQGAKLGAGYGAVGGASQAAQEGTSVVGGAVTGGLIGGATGGLLEGGVGKVSSMLSKRAGVAGEFAPKVEKAAGQIFQGSEKISARDIEILKGLNPKATKTYNSAVSTFDEKLKTLTKSQDLLLAKDLQRRKLPQLTASSQVGDKAIKHNYVKDAIDQLESHYKRTNDVAGQTTLKQLKAKLTKEGLTVKEINDLARTHGRDLNAYNKSGDLSAALSKQEFENTRSGLKTTVRQLFGGTKSKAIDKDISDTIRVRERLQDMAEKVISAERKVQKAGIFEKLGHAGLTIADFASFGFLRGALSAARGYGVTKNLSALDIESKLSKNLKILNKIEAVVDQGGTKESLLEKINKIINQEVVNTDVVNENFKKKIIESAKNPTIGLSIKNVGKTPEELAREQFKKRWADAYGNRPAKIDSPSQLQLRKNLVKNVDPAVEKGVDLKEIR